MPLRSLVIAFGLAIASFFASTLYSQRSSRAIDRAAESIATNGMPSIQRVSAARAEMRRLWLELHRYTSSADRERRNAIDEARAAVDGEVDEYLALPTYPGEREMWRALHHDLARVDRAVDGVLALVEQGTLSATDPARKPAEAAIDHAIGTMRDVIDFNARNAALKAAEIKDARVRSDRIAILLDAMSALLTLVVAWLAVRALRHYERVREERNRLMATRAEELEQFAGRVAHDVLGPLSATSVAIQLARRRSNDEQLKSTLDRGTRGLTRVQTIVDGLLRFARAGARPEAGVRTRLRPVIEDLVQELGPFAAERDVTLVVDGLPEVTVAANTGVLTSLVENLVRNAVKYMLNARERRVVVRAAATDQRVRVEVRDTGPGIAPALLPRVFQPYVRGEGSSQPGIGLGLATVRRIVEAHGGTVGVESSPAGSLFWFELPRSSDAEATDAASAAPALH